jgi:tetratricopeptide (TPR) repeat protein
MKPSKKFHLSFLIINIFIFLSSIAFGQGEEKFKNVFIEAESYFLFEEYKDALPLYQKILQSDPDNYNLNYKVGICYLNDVYQVQKSLSYLEKAVTGIDANAKSNSFKEKKAPPEAFYYLGNAYRTNNKLKDAIEAYEQFKLVLDPLVYDVELVDAQIAACKVAALQESKPMYFISANLGEPINERFEESNPVVSGDESVIAFTRKLQFYDAVFCSRKINGKWSEPENLTEAFGVDGNSYTTGLSYNGDELFVYRSDNFDGNLYVSKYKNNTWSKLQKLNSNINTKYWESHASISKDGKTLYFTSNRGLGPGFESWTRYQFKV